MKGIRQYQNIIFGLDTMTSFYEVVIKGTLMQI